MSVERIDLAPGYAISRMIRGGWQLAGGHGPVDGERALEDMFAFLDVAAVIIGSRYAHHLDSALGMFKVKLDDADRAAIDAVAGSGRRHLHTRARP